MSQPSAVDRALTSVLDHLDAGREAALDRLFRLLSIPSVSTDPAFHADCLAAAEWCAGALREIGFEAEVRATPGKPMVVGHWREAGAKRRSHVLFYGHYERAALRAASCRRPTVRPGHRRPRRLRR